MHSFPKALAKRTRKSTELNASFRLAFNLRFVWLPTCVALRWNYDDLRWLWSNSNSYASRRKIFTFWPPNASRRKLIASWCKSTVYAWNSWLFATCVNLRADLRIRLATHRKSVRKIWFCKLVSTCIDLWIRRKHWDYCGFCPIFAFPLEKGCLSKWRLLNEE